MPSSGINLVPFNTLHCTAHSYLGDECGVLGRFSSLLQFWCSLQWKGSWKHFRLLAEVEHALSTNLPMQATS